ncbi:MAG TPA: DUF3857 domain-containing protein [Candidatus Acidoferrum sp.]|nr:DUF3857 domain-containing protein [Candidatus Acidoferrum sp.]
MPAIIELLETTARFDADGTGRKEVHALVKIKDELGVRQFARLSFSFDRAFQQVEIPLVRITHSSGGTVDVLPSAITDQPDPAVVNAPAYQDVRVKSVRVLGLEPGDTIEYRVITTTSHPPLAPDFWFEHSFDRSGVVAHEIFELDLPSSLKTYLRVNPETPAEPTSPERAGQPGRSVDRWDRKQSSEPKTNEAPRGGSPDVTVTSFASWDQLAGQLEALILPTAAQSSALRDKAAAMSAGDASARKRLEDIYEYVAQKIRTVDLPLGATGFRSRPPAETLASGYGTPEDKFTLFAALANNFCNGTRAGFASSTGWPRPEDAASPGGFDHLLTYSACSSANAWMDLNVEVAPFAVVPVQFREKPVFVVGPATDHRWETLVAPLPFHSSQNVKIDARIDEHGELRAKVRYTMRGDNELLLRVTFHRTPERNWKNVAQLLAYSDGFRGQITNVDATDPYEIRRPFTVEFEIVQPKFLDWAKKPVRMPALLPIIGLPDLASKSDEHGKAPRIDLGTPLDVELNATLHLPAGTGVEVPAGTTLNRDFATYSSEYSAKDDVISASRHANFILREIPADRAVECDAFLHAVQNDESQLFTLERAAAPPPKQQK